MTHSAKWGLTRWRSSIALVVVCLGLSGCATKDRVRYYAINLPAAMPAAANPAGVALIVGRIVLAPALQDGRIRYRAGKTEVGGYENHRWSEPPSVAVRDGLIRLLRASGRYQAVSQAGASAGGDYLVRGKLREFSEVDEPSMHTSVSLWLEVYDRKRSRVVWQQEFTREEPVSGRSVADVADSLDSGTQALLGEAVGAINAYLAGQAK